MKNILRGRLVVQTLSISKSTRTTSRYAFPIRQFCDGRQRPNDSHNLNGSHEGFLERSDFASSLQHSDIGSSHAALIEAIPYNANSMPTLAEAAEAEGKFEWEVAYERLKQANHVGNTAQYQEAIKLCSIGRQLDKCIDLLVDMKENNIPRNRLIYKNIILACAHFNPVKSRHELAISLMKEFEADPCYKPCLYVYNATIHCCAKAGKYQHAIGLFIRMQRKNIIPDIFTCNCVLDACNLSRKYDMAMLVMKTIDHYGLEPNQVTYTTLLNTCARTEKYDKAFQLFDEILNNHAEPPNVYMFNAVLNACAKKGDLKKALLYFNDMKFSGIKPSRHTISLLITVYGKLGMNDKALEWINEVVQNNIHVSVQTYNQALLSCAKIGEQQTALEIFDRMKLRKVSLQINVYSYKALLECCRNDFDKASEIFAEWRKLYAEDKVKMDAHCYNLMLEICQQHNKHQEAVQHFEDLRQYSKEGKKDHWEKIIRPSVYTYELIMDICNQSRMYKRSLLYFDQITFNIDMKASKQVYRTAVATLSDLLNFDKDIDYVSPVEAENTTTGATPTKTVHRAGITFADMVKHVDTDYTTFDKDSIFRTAMTLYDEMINGRGFNLNQETVIRLIHICRDSGKYAKALELYDKMMSYEFTQPNAPLYNALISCLLESGQAELAKDYLCEMTEEHGLTGDEETFLIQLHMDAEDDVHVLQVYRAASDAGVELSTDFFNQVLICLADNNKDRMTAVSELDAGEAEITSVPAVNAVFTDLLTRGLSPDVDTLSALLACVDPQSLTAVKKGYELFNRFINQFGVQPDVFCYARMISCFAEHNLWQYCAKLVTDMQQQGLEPDVEVVAALISVFEATGQSEEAIKWYLSALRRKLFNHTNLSKQYDLSLFSPMASLTASRVILNDIVSQPPDRPFYRYYNSKGKNLEILTDEMLGSMHGYEDRRTVHSFMKAFLTTRVYPPLELCEQQQLGTLSFTQESVQRYAQAHDANYKTVEEMLGRDDEEEEFDLDSMSKEKIDQLMKMNNLY